MEYIRTKYGIYENLSTNAYIRSVGVAKVCIKHIDEETLEESFEFRMCKIEDIIKQADTIEELMQDGDLCHLAKCAVCRDQISVVRVIPRESYIAVCVPGIEYTADDVLELWVKDEKGNYIKTAERNEKGELELL